MESKTIPLRINEKKSCHPFYRASIEERLKMLDDFWKEAEKNNFNKDDLRTLKIMRGKDGE